MLHNPLELLALFGRENGFDLLVDAVHFLSHLRLKLRAHLPDAFLTFNHELLNFLPLFSRELELTIQSQDELTIQQAGLLAGLLASLVSKFRFVPVIRILWATRIVRLIHFRLGARVHATTTILSELHQRRAGDDARNKYDERGQNYFPSVHQSSSC